MIKNKIILIICLIFFFLLFDVLNTDAYDDYSDIEKELERSYDFGIIIMFLSVGVPAIFFVIYASYASNKEKSLEKEKHSQTCPNCNRNIKPFWSLCPYCGQELKHLCPSCKKAIEPNWKICPYCGESLKETCPYCGRYVDKDWKICPYCKGSLLNSQ